MSSDTVAPTARRTQGVHIRALEHFRISAGRTRVELLRDAGMTSEYLGQRLRDGGQLTTDEIALLARAVRVHPRELITKSTVLFAADRLRTEGI